MISFALLFFFFFPPLCPLPSKLSLSLHTGFQTFGLPILSPVLLGRGRGSNCVYVCLAVGCGEPTHNKANLKDISSVALYNLSISAGIFGHSEHNFLSGSTED